MSRAAACRLAGLAGLVVALAAGGPVAHAGGPAADRDADGDGVLVPDDRCPARIGAPPDGCPPRDGDGDGVLDGADACPELPGLPAASGCPAPDGDGDGVADRVDACPDRRGRARDRGCPEPDGDGDGWPDSADRCPRQAEVWNGRRDQDGCPDAGAALVVEQGGGVRLAAPPHLVGGRRGLLAGSTREALGVASALVRRRGAVRLTIVSVAPHGLSYGDSLEQARRAGEQAAAFLAAHGWSADRLVIDARGPDGAPRIELAPY